MKSLTNSLDAAKESGETLSHTKDIDDVEQTIRLIEACARSGVQSLKRFDLEVTFHPRPREKEIEPEARSEGEALELKSGIVEASEEDLGGGDLISPEVLEEIRLSTLMIEDPLAFEQEMMDRAKETEG